MQTLVNKLSDFITIASFWLESIAIICMQAYGMIIIILSTLIKIYIYIYIYFEGAVYKHYAAIALITYMKIMQA